MVTLVTDRIETWCLGSFSKEVVFEQRPAEREEIKHVPCEGLQEEVGTGELCEEVEGSRRKASVAAAT